MVVKQKNNKAGATCPQHEFRGVGSYARAGVLHHQVSDGSRLLCSQCQERFLQNLKTIEKIGLVNVLMYDAY